MKCQMALLKSSKGVVGEWCIQTVMNTLSGFEPLRRKCGGVLVGSYRLLRRLMTTLDALIRMICQRPKPL